MKLTTPGHPPLAILQNAIAFDQDIGECDTSSVTDMNEMFYQAAAFNNSGQPLDWADTSSVDNISGMVKDAIAFNQDISSWNASPTGCTDLGERAAAWLDAYDGSIASNPPLNDAMALVCGP